LECIFVVKCNPRRATLHVFVDLIGVDVLKLFLIKTSWSLYAFFLFQIIIHYRLNAPT